MNKVDIIILSYAKNTGLQAVTQNALASLWASEDPEKLAFNVIVIESNRSLKPFSYPGTRTIYPSCKFNFNKYLNIGIKSTANKYVCLCNNDLIFHHGWASRLIEQFDNDESLMSASPVCSVFHPTIGIQLNTGNYYGYAIRNEISGWCIFVKRSIFESIGALDERFKFWFADRDYAKTIENLGHKHALVTTSIVDHLDGISTMELNAKAKLALTSEQYWYFQYKWEHHNWLLYIYRRLRSNLRVLNKKNGTD